jgi:hypothetical protein
VQMGDLKCSDDEIWPVTAAAARWNNELQLNARRIKWAEVLIHATILLSDSYGTVLWNQPQPTHTNTVVPVLGGWVSRCLGRMVAGMGSRPIMSAREGSDFWVCSILTTFNPHSCSTSLWRFLKRKKRFQNPTASTFKMNRSDSHERSLVNRQPTFCNKTNI